MTETEVTVTDEDARAARLLIELNKQLGVETDQAIRDIADAVEVSNGVDLDPVLPTDTDWDNQTGAGPKASIDDLIGELRLLFGPASERSAMDLEASDAGVRLLQARTALADEFPRRVASAKWLRVMATNADRFVEIQSQALAQAIAHGCNIRILLQGQEQISGRPKVSSDEIRSVATRLREIVASAAELAPQKQRSSSLGVVYIGYLQNRLVPSLALIDETWGWMTLHHQLKAPETMTVELDNSGSGGASLLATCIEQFDQFWHDVERAGEARTLTAK